MSHSHTLEALVLKTYDVGEADRYCILFTRERGRIAVRASGVRKPKSRMGASLIAFRHLTVTVREHRSGWYASGAAVRSEREGAGTLASFAASVRGIELLLRLVHDEGELPGVFDATLSFLRLCERGERHASLAYSFRLLHLLGLLPSPDDVPAPEDFPPAAEAFLHAAAAGDMPPSMTDADARMLEDACDRLLKDHLTVPLKVPGVIGAIQFQN